MKEKLKGRNFPNLRFPNYTDEWKERRLEDLGFFIGGGTPDTTNQQFWTGKIPWISSSDLSVDDIGEIFKTRFINDNAIKSSATKLIPKGGILMVSRVGIGKFAVADEDLCTSQDFTNLVTNQNAYFLCYYFSTRSKYFVKLSQGTSIKGFTIQDIRSSVFPVPTLQEQENISSFLSVIDSRIRTQRKIIEGLIILKNNFVKQLFENKLKFRKGERVFPKWVKKKLSEISEEHLHKNPDNLYPEVFSVAKHKGVINQIEHLGRSFSAKDIKHYKLVYPGDLVYTKSPTSEFPYGIIKQNRTGRIGVVSPLYCVFTPQTFELGYLLHEYFNSAVNTFNYLNPLVQKGAKNTMNINNDTFLNGAKILLPINQEEQENIYRFLQSYNGKINLERDILAQYENQKKFLLANLFV